MSPMTFGLRRHRAGPHRKSRSLRPHLSASQFGTETDPQFQGRLAVADLSAPGLEYVPGSFL